MTDMHLQSSEETLWSSQAPRPAAIGGVKPYLTAVLVVTLLMSVWAGLCSV
jgi:hypothetical protein